MHKSQLRRLALDFAHGNLDAEDYRRQRAELLDAIVAGQTPIDREPPLDIDVTQPSVVAPAAERRERAAPPAPPARAALSPLHMGVGAGALVLVVVVALWLFSGGEAEPPPPATTVVTEPVRPAEPAVPPARQLVERFVAEKNFSTGSLERFRDAWTALEPADVDAARGTPWFRRMVSAVVQEVKTQKALADLDATGEALQRAHRVVDFGRFLGVSEGMLPAVEQPAESAAEQSATEATAATSAPVAGETAGTAPTGTPPATGTTTPAPVETTALPSPPAGQPAPDTPTLATLPSLPDPAAPVATPLPPAQPAPRGREWLRAQPRDAYTLQLFALNHLERVERLIARHPQLQLRLVDYAPDEPRYRVFLGRYDSPAEARVAHASLPEDVRIDIDQPAAFVRPIGELVEALPATQPVATAMTALPAAEAAAAEPPPSLSSAWLQEQPSNRFTLQLFASNNLDNAARLIGRFPDLALALHESEDAATRYRVLYGSFASAEEARRAFDALPGPLATGAGVPLVRSIGELQASETAGSRQ